MMMKSYNRKKRNMGPAIFILFFIGLIIILFKPFSSIVKSTGKSLWSINMNNSDYFSNIFHSKKSLSEENRKLIQELNEANLKLVELSVLGDENKKIKELLGRSGNDETIFAGLITNPNQSLYNTFNIDAGSVDGIKLGAKVFVGDAFIGKVTDVFDKYSTVTSLSNPGEETNAVVSESDISITVIGRGGDFEVDLPRDIPFQPGMAIVSQGSKPKIIAIIEKIISDPRDPFQKVLARLPMNMRTVRWVFIEKI